MKLHTKLKKIIQEETPPLNTDSEGGYTSKHLGDRELFIRKVFETNPQRGLELLFKQYYSALCSHAVRFVYARQIAEDLVSEVFYSFWQNKHYQQITTSYQAYLFSAVRNKSLNYLKWEFSKANHKDIADFQAIPDREDSPQQIMQYDELCQSIEKAILQLPPNCQKVFLMSRFGGKKNQPIA
jgi:RNA polymerase sigma factor (sigma-70 family)